MPAIFDPKPALLQQEFDEKGYVLLPYMVPPVLLNKLRQLMDDQMLQSDNPHRVTNICNGNRYTTNVDHLMHKGNLACLELLGCPFILQTASAVCGDDFFLIQEFAVIKMLGDNTPVLWHQDMLHKRTGRCFTMGIYLDDAAEGDGCLNIIPGSHLSNKPICELKNETAIALPVMAGQIMIHDMMLAHSSEPMQRNHLRRVIYFEFLSAKHVLREGIYREELLQNRFALLETAIEHYRKLHPGDALYNWNNPYRKGDQQLPALEKLCSVQVHAKTSAYCLEHF